jgi:hypothetical protein
MDEAFCGCADISLIADFVAPDAVRQEGQE